MIDRKLTRRAERLRTERVPFVHATVVRVSRPSSAHAGDAALVLEDGTIEGFVGGACVQASVRLHAARALETGEPLLLRVLPEPADASAQSREGTAVACSQCLSGGSVEIFLDPQPPVPRVVVVGEAPIAQALERLATAAGYDVQRAAAEHVKLHADDAAVVVASHGGSEVQVLSAALREGVPYVALVASRRRGEAVRGALTVPDELKAQLHTPAGLDLGARTPAEVAVAILAEIVADRRAPPDLKRAPGTQARARGAGQEAERGAPAAAPAIDPVCGMPVALTPATPKLETEQGPVYFCSEHCRAAYRAQHAGDVATR